MSQPATPGPESGGARLVVLKRAAGDPPGPQMLMVETEDGRLWTLQGVEEYTVFARRHELTRLEVSLHVESMEVQTFAPPTMF